MLGSLFRSRRSAFVVLASAALLGALSPANAALPKIPDLGDAPASNNNFGLAMLAYPAGPVAQFPTVYFAGAAPTGPYHQNLETHYYLGSGAPGVSITAETQADVGADADGVNNIRPNVPASNLDKGDDGVAWPIFGTCQKIQIKYTVTILNPATGTAYLNLWADWNSNGRWGDVFPCSTTTNVDEWAVQNVPVALPGAGTFVFVTPFFVPQGPTGRPQWARITISNTPQGTRPGQGPGASWRLGETEDYILP